jgi:hypothetical protein
MSARSKALWAVAALLLANAVLLVAQPALALPRSLGSYFFGPKLIRAEVLLVDKAELRHFRIDRGVIRDKAGGVLALRERDGTVVHVPISPAATITLGGRQVTLARLSRGMNATVIREGDGPAVEVRATRR